MQLTEPVRRPLSHYEGECPWTKANLTRLLMHGQLGGTGRLLNLPVDQGFEHRPTLSLAPNPPACNPDYLFRLAIDARFSALAASPGLLEAGAETFAGSVPLILTANSANALSRVQGQAVTGTVRDALQLGCAAVGYTVYFCADAQYEQIEEVREAIAEPRDAGLAVVVWAYPRGGDLSEDARTALDVVSYAVHMAALMGAHIINTKAPDGYLERDDAGGAFEESELGSLSARVSHVMPRAFDGRRVVLGRGRKGRGRRPRRGARHTSRRRDRVDHRAQYLSAGPGRGFLPAGPDRGDLSWRDSLGWGSVQTRSGETEDE